MIKEKHGSESRSVHLCSGDLNVHESICSCHFSQIGNLQNIRVFKKHLNALNAGCGLKINSKIKSGNLIPYYLLAGKGADADKIMLCFINRFLKKLEDHSEDYFALITSFIFHFHSVIMNYVTDE